MAPESVVERRKNLSVEEFRARYAIPGVPVVLEGLAEKWPARQLWTLEFFKQNYAATEVTVYTSGRKTNPRNMQLSSYLEYMETTKDEVPDYLRAWCLSSYPQLRAQYRRPAHFPCWTDRLPSEVRPTWKWLYIGPAGSGSAMHRDFMGTAAWNMLFEGEKSWCFYPPDQTFPLPSAAEALSCVQKPGDIVFTPSNWWHQVRNETSTLALTENFINDTNGRYLCADDEQDRRTLMLLADHGIEPLSMMSLPS